MKTMLFAISKLFLRLSGVVEYWKPSVTGDTCVVTKNESGEDVVLLIQRVNEPYKGKWAFPGGFLDELDEFISSCAKRELEEETGLDMPLNDFIKISVYDDKDRDPRGRVITHAFLVDKRDTCCHDERYSGIRASDDADKYGWFEINNLPKLAFDHELIMKDVKNKLY